MASSSGSQQGITLGQGKIALVSNQAHFPMPTLLSNMATLPPSNGPFYYPEALVQSDLNADTAASTTLPLSVTNPGVTSSVAQPSAGDIIELSSDDESDESEIQTLVDDAEERSQIPTPDLQIRA